MFATAAFFTALASIVMLFAMKRLEVARPARFGERFRTSADTGAVRIKILLERGESMLENIPWFLLALLRYSIHIGALSFARLARLAAIQAHRLADLASHKHRFERRETKSTFLKNVSEYKNGNGDGPVATP